MKTKKWLYIATFLTISGLLLCTLAVMLGFDIRKPNKSSEYVTKTNVINEGFRNIEIDADTEKVSFVLSSDNVCKVVFREKKDRPHQTLVRNDTLLIKEGENDLNSWSMNLSGEEMSITVYLPKTQYDVLKIDSDTGDIIIPEGFSFEEIDIDVDTAVVDLKSSSRNDISITTDTGAILISNVSCSDMELESDTGRMELTYITTQGDLTIKEDTGKVVLDNVKCNDLDISSDTGSITLNYVLASEDMTLGSDTGSVELNDVDARNIKIETTTGKVNGVLLSAKQFVTKTSTGKVDVPDSNKGGKCEIVTNTGSITIRIR